MGTFIPLFVSVCSSWKKTFDTFFAGVALVRLQEYCDKHGKKPEGDRTLFLESKRKNGIEGLRKLSEAVG